LQHLKLYFRSSSLGRHQHLRWCLGRRCRRSPRFGDHNSATADCDPHTRQIGRSRWQFGSGWRRRTRWTSPGMAHASAGPFR